MYFPRRGSEEVSGSWICRSTLESWRKERAKQLAGGTHGTAHIGALKHRSHGHTQGQNPDSATADTAKDMQETRAERESSSSRNSACCVNTTIGKHYLSAKEHKRPQLLMRRNASSTLLLALSYPSPTILLFQ